MILYKSYYVVSAIPLVIYGGAQGLRRQTLGQLAIGLSSSLLGLLFISSLRSEVLSGVNIYRYDLIHTRCMGIVVRICWLFLSCFMWMAASVSGSFRHPGDSNPQLVS